jgi:hypothetical protein
VPDQPVRVLAGEPDPEFVPAGTRGGTVAMPVAGEGQQHVASGGLPLARRFRFKLALAAGDIDELILGEHAALGPGELIQFGVDPQRVGAARRHPRRAGTGGVQAPLLVAITDGQGAEVFLWVGPSWTSPPGTPPDTVGIVKLGAWPSTPSSSSNPFTPLATRSSGGTAYTNWCNTANSNGPGAPAAQAISTLFCPSDGMGGQARQFRHCPGTFCVCNYMAFLGDRPYECSLPVWHERFHLHWGPGLQTKKAAFGISASRQAPLVALNNLA